MGDVNIKMTPEEYRLYREWIDGDHKEKAITALKVATPVLKTECGAIIYNPDQRVYDLNTNSWGYSNTGYAASTAATMHEKYKWFINPEDLQEYIEYNKPCLSQKEVNEVLVEVMRKQIVEDKYSTGEYQEAIKCALDTYVMEKLNK